MSNIEKIKESLLNNKTRNEVFDNSLVGNVFDIYEVSKVEINHLFRDGVLGIKTVKMYYHITNIENTHLSFESKERLVSEIGNYSNEINMVDFENDDEVDFLLKIIKDDLYNKFNKEANDLGMDYLTKSYKDFYNSREDSDVKVRFLNHFMNYRNKGISAESLKLFVKCSFLKNSN